MYIDVLVEVKAKKIDNTFTYSVPDNLKDKICVGIRVLVPFKSREIEGFVLALKDEKPSYDTKDIIGIIDVEPVINEEMMELGRFISKNTFSGLISCYQTMLPVALKAKHNTLINKKYETYLVLIDDKYIPKTEPCKAVLNLFNDGDKVLKRDALKESLSAVNTLKKLKVIKEVKEESYRLKMKSCTNDSNLEMTKEQTEVYNTVIKDLNIYKPYLLHGVTGSGKTEVYMRVIENVLKLGKEVIVLVPEISLTPQMVEKFRNRFGENVAILHSRLSDGEKYDEWRKITRKEVSIAIGARSAVFAPFTNLGMIIIDEEHTTTYKQENTPRYNAIDIAIYRAKRNNCPLILGSATPSLESYAKTKNGTYTLLEMKNRVNKNLPKVKLIDMKNEIKKGNSIISEDLDIAINERLKNKEQVIILLNRRGFSTVITCKSCGYVDKCPKCDIPLTYHKGINKMKCHYCNYESSIHTTCPACKDNQINYFGLGTEKLEEELTKMYETAKIIRMDVDTTYAKNSHERIITAFGNGEYDILIGTQMIAKGLDFPNVTLVGVINGDAILNIPDFRSAERTFQLLNQVSGRAGRGEKLGNVIIQGYNIDHYSIVLSSVHDYKTFFKKELDIRKTLKYPPYCNLAFIRINSKDLNVGLKEASNIAKFISSKGKDITLLGPSMASIPKINSIYNIQIIIKYKSIKDIYKELSYLNDYYKNLNNIEFGIDINPLRV